MPRIARLFEAGMPVHAMQRGHNKMVVFVDKFDFEYYLEALFDALEVDLIDLHAYALMNNHIHLLLTAPSKEALSRLFQSVGRRYVQHFNKRHARSGTLWEGRFKSCLINSERYLLEVYRYIELNPVRAGIVEYAKDYQHSSYRHHAGIATNNRIKDHPLFWSLGNTPFERQAAYKALVDEGLTAHQVARITDQTLRGLPIDQVASTSIRPRGRPTKSTTLSLLNSPKFAATI